MRRLNEIVKYIEKLKNMADYLARGNFLIAPDEQTAIQIMEDEIVNERGAFSIQEYSVYDTLELSSYGEQKSIGILMRYLEDGEYEKQVKGKINFKKPYEPEDGNTEFYQMVMKRVNVLLKSMALSLVCGRRIPMVIEYDRGDRIDWKKGDLVFSREKGYFCLIGEEGEILQKDVDINTVMMECNSYLIELEQKRLKEKTEREKDVLKKELEEEFKKKKGKEQRPRDENERE